MPSKGKGAARRDRSAGGRKGHGTSRDAVSGTKQNNVPTKRDLAKLKK